MTGSLFWRFFWFFWLAQVATSLAVGGAVWLLHPGPEIAFPALIQPPLHPPTLFPLIMPIVAGGVVSLVFAALMAAYVTRPIRRLDIAFKAISEGKLDERIGTALASTNDELTALASGFDHMAGRLQSLVDSQRSLLHDVSHEMRAPLARLQAAADLMDRSPTRVTELTERQRRDIERMNALVEELLTLARIEAGGVFDDWTDVILRELLEGVAEDAHFDAEHKRCKVMLDCNSTLLVRGNHELLHRAFDNVVRNAVRHAPEGTAVTISAILQSNQVRVAISDEGSGVADNEVEHIFEPFIRGHNAPTGGFGLGLAISRRAIQVHQGSVVAENNDGGGLCVIVTLPLSCRVEMPVLSTSPLNIVRHAISEPAKARRK